MGFRSALAASLLRLAVRAEGGAVGTIGWKERLGDLRMLRRSRSGKAFTPDTALELPVVLAVVQRIAFGIAQVPWKAFREEAMPGGQGRVPALDHPLYDILHLRPNGFQTSFEFRVMLMLHLLLIGEFFAYKVMTTDRRRGGAGQIITELLPFELGRVRVEQLPDWTLKYWVRAKNGGEQEVPASSIWHVRGISLNGWQGLKTVDLLRDALGLADVAQSAQLELQKSGSRIPGVVAFDGKLTEGQYKDLTKWLKENALASFDELGLLVLDSAAKFQSVTMTGREAQTIETRRHQIEEVCRGWGMFPFMIGHPADMAARGASETIGILHVVHTLDPWMVALEQAADVGLLTPAERKTGMFTRFIRAGLMRGDLKSQAEWAGKALGQGATGEGQAWAVPNEIRDLYEWNPLPGGDQLPRPKPPASAGTSGA